MPTLELQVNSLTDEHCAFTGAYVLSLMLFPRDETGREAFLDGLIGEGLAKAIKKSTEPVTINARMAKWLTSATNDVLRKEKLLSESLRSFKGSGDSHIHRGVIAGEIVLTALLTRAQTGEIVGPAAAISGLIKNYAAANLRGASAESIRKAWQKYQCVAHLWAADIVCQRNGHGGVGANKLTEGGIEAFIQFLDLAEQIRFIGQQHRAAGCPPLLNEVEMLKALGPESCVARDLPIPITLAADDQLMRDATFAWHTHGSGKRKRAKA